MIAKPVYAQTATQIITLTQRQMDVLPAQVFPTASHVIVQQESAQIVILDIIHIQHQMAVKHVLQ